MRAPRGKGLYLRAPGSYDDRGGIVAYCASLGVKWVAALPWYPTTLLQEMRGAGLEVYVYQGPTHMTPTQVLGELDKLVTVARSNGLAGIIVDIEGGWGASAHDAVARQVADAMLAAVASGLSVGWTSYPAHRLTGLFGSLVGSKCWGNPQLYSQAGAEPSKTQAWVSKWKASGWSVVIPAAAAYSTPGLDRGPAYWAAIASVSQRAVIAWTTTSPPRLTSELGAAFAALKTSPFFVPAGVLAVGCGVLATAIYFKLRGA